jgi:hypothetical protein
MELTGQDLIRKSKSNKTLSALNRTIHVHPYVDIKASPPDKPHVCLLLPTGLTLIIQNCLCRTLKYLPIFQSGTGFVLDARSLLK